MKDATWQILSAIFIIALVYMLVRPSSPAGDAVKDIGTALTNMIQTAVAGPQPGSNSAQPAGDSGNPVTAV